MLAIPLDSNQFTMETDASEARLVAGWSIEENGGFQPVEFYFKTVEV